MIRPVDFVVDPSVYADSSRFNDEGATLEALVRLDLRHHFSGPSGAAYWNALCDAPEYGHHRLVQTIDSAFPELLRETQLASRRRPMRLVSLGPGNGEIDVRLLAHMERAFDVAAYWCVDSSFELLRCAVSRVANASELRTEFPIEALCADFTQVEPRPPRGHAYVLSLLGWTLGNYREAFLVDQLKRWMTPESHLLIDARLWSLNGWNGARELSAEERDAVTRGLTYPARNRFVFGPVEVVTTATAREVTFEHDVNRSVTSVPGALNVVTCCSNLRARMRLTDEPVEREQIPLAATTLYKYDELRSWFGSVGFDVRWSKNAGSIGLFLLRLAQAK